MKQFIMSYYDGYKIRNKEGIYFITFAVTAWVDAFTRVEYKKVIVDNLKYCQDHKGLKLYAWCLMSNHIHLIATSSTNTLSEFLRDFKKHTSKALVDMIKTNSKESRKDWMLGVFSEIGKKHNKEIGYQFWRHDNHPIELLSEGFTRQKLEYIHRNPVTAGIVDKEEEYLYSSARDYYYGRNCGLLKIDYLF